MWLLLLSCQRGDVDLSAGTVAVDPFTGEAGLGHALDALTSDDLQTVGVADDSSTLRLGGTVQVADGTVTIAPVLTDGTVTKSLETLSGSTADVIALEKAMVEDVLDVLGKEADAATKLAVNRAVPTDSYAALVAWGEGLSLRAAGQDADAVDAFERSLLRDPDFGAPRAELEDLRRHLEGARASIAAADDPSGAWAAVEQLPTDAVGVALRMAVLDQQKRPCAKVALMRQHMGLAGTRGLDRSIVRAARRAGLEVDATGLPSFDPVRRQGVLLSSVERFHVGTHPDLERPQGLAGALDACGGAGEQLHHLGELIAADPPGKVGPVTLVEHLRLRAAFLRARHYGTSEALTAEVAALLAAYPPASKGHRFVTEVVETVEAEALAHRMRGGRTDLELVVFNRQLVSGSGPMLDRSSWLCTNWIKGDRALAAVIDDEYREAERLPDGRIWQLGELYFLYREMGCIAGTPGRYRNAKEVLTAMDSLVPDPDNLTSECRRELDGMEQYLGIHRRFVQMGMGDDDMFIRSVLSDYHDLLGKRCVIELK